MKKVNVTLRPSQWVNLPWLLIAIFCVYQIITINSDMSEYNYYMSQNYGEYESIGINPFTWFYLIGVLRWFWKYLVIRCWSFYMDEDSEIIVEKRGVFSRTITQIHYFRIKSVQVWQPIFLRIFGLSSVQVITSEPFKPVLIIYAIYDGEGWAHYCKEMAKYWRNVKGVKETDFHSF